MKTSNKLLAAVSLLLITAAVVNALTLKNRFNAMVAGTPALHRDFHATDFNSVELSGTAPRGLGAYVSVKRADRGAVRYTGFDFIHIEQEGTTLKITIDHPSGYNVDIRTRPEIVIECPELIAFTAAGTPLDSLDLPTGAHLSTKQFYRRSQVDIQDFRGSRLRVAAANGMEVTLRNTVMDSLMAAVDRAGKLEIQQNELAHIILDVRDEGMATLDQTQVRTMSTKVADNGQLILKGNQSITAHGNGEHRNP